MTTKPNTRKSLPQKVSVIVPTRDRCGKIAACLASLDQQSVSGFETIIVNDGSTDDTRSFLDTELSKTRCHRLIVIHHETAAGANPSRNEAIAASHGQLVAFLDDDCIADPDWLHNLVAGMDDEVAAATGFVKNIALSNQWERFFIGQHRVSARNENGIAHARRLVNGNLVVRREFLDGALDEDRESVASDVKTSARGDEEGLRIRLHRSGKIMVFVDDAIVLHDHPYTFHSFCRQAFKSGQSTARLARRYGLSPRWELVCLLLAFALVVPALLWSWVWLAVVGLLSLFGAAASYNELFLKRKTFGQFVTTGPGFWIYYPLRAIGYGVQWFTISLGR